MDLGQYCGFRSPLGLAIAASDRSGAMAKRRDPTCIIRVSFIFLFHDFESFEIRV